jgi:hypothetical protein
MTYAEKLKSPEWQKRRLDILNRDNWACQYCTDTKAQLHVHHLKYSGDPIKEPDENLITACCACHQIISWVKKNQKVDITATTKYLFPDENELQIIAAGSNRRLYIFWYYKDSDTIDFRCTVSDGCISRVNDYFFPKPAKSRKKKHGQTND